MLFNSAIFALFLPTVLLVYYLLRRREQNLWLLCASYFFYGWWDWRFLFLIFISTVVDYIAGLRIHAGDREASRKRWLILSVCVNLGILGFFKYFDFFSASLATACQALGWNVSFSVLHIVVPVGISFYTFQTMSYTIDIYRRKMQPTRDFFTFALYVAYFPQLVAGPIERASRLLPQLQSDRTVTADKISSGSVLILIGLFKKVLIADSLSKFVDITFAEASTAHAMDLLRALYFFSIQIYCDFSGYSDIARGVSRLFGVELIENFNQPYFSTNITEFWRRWHISLSSWLRDYLYISLGGNRRGKRRTYANLFITMFLGGLWHGANWTFVAWGTIHGIYLAVHKAILGNRKPPERMKVNSLKSAFMFTVKLFLTFHLVSFTWIFFRAPTFAVAWDYFTGIITLRGDTPFGWRQPLAFLILLLLVDVPQYLSRNHTIILHAPVLVRGFYYAVMLLALIIFGGGLDEPFIYFQF